MLQVVRTQKEIQALSKELEALLKKEGVIGVEVRAVPVKAITDRQREVLTDLLDKFGYDPENSALPETAKDASRLIAYFLKRTKRKKGYGRRRTSAQKKS